MDKEQALAILRSCRSGGRHPDDPEIAAARAVVAQDPDAHHFLEGEHALDDAIAHQLGGLQPPPGLKESILAGLALPEPSPRPAVPRRRAVLMAVSLLIVSTLAAVVWLPVLTSRPDSFASFLTEMRDFLPQGFRLHYANADLAAVARWFAETHDIAHYQVPLALATQTRATGCRTIDWYGQKAALICFYTSDGKVVHLVVLDRAAVPDPPTSARPSYARRDQWTSATWSAGDKAYLVLSTLDEARLRALL